MRFLLPVLFYLFLLTGTFGQSVLSQKPTRTVFSIRAVDDETSAELSARFTTWAQLADQKFVGQSQPGTSYSFVLTRTDTLNVVAGAPGHYESEEVMVVSCDTCANYEYTIRLESKSTSKQKAASIADTVFRGLAVNQTFELDNVYFDQSSYVLRPESYPQLNKLTKTLAVTPSLVIEIAGHTDNVGDRRLNQALSENRAKIIRNYLIRNGIAENRLHPNGYGDKRPVAPNDSEENKRKNRRVEFVVVAL